MNARKLFSLNPVKSKSNNNDKHVVAQKCDALMPNTDLQVNPKYSLKYFVLRSLKRQYLILYNLEKVIGT